MTTKVVKGSVWTLAGQVLPMTVALIATPFTIRFLGSEGYGVLILVGLIPTYFAFADFGMGIASTKFGSEAYGEGKPEKEGEIVRTAAVIALLTSLAFALPIFLFSSLIVAEFNVPEHFQTAASIALKITSAAFVLGILGSVVNTPMLARLRMDMNSITGTVPKVLMAVITPFVLYLGGGVVGAAWVAFSAGVLAVATIVYFSGRLLPQLFRLSVNREFVRPLIKFGGGWLIGSVAAIFLLNLEKIFLTRFVSVRSLAFYSVAFTFANMATMFSQSMLQSLVPAFSQMMTPEKQDQRNLLFSNLIRLNLIFLLPSIMFLAVIANPFFTLWAGPEFGAESTGPLYILLFGLFLSIVSYIPFSAILAAGRSDIFAKLYWIELVIYAGLAFILINAYGTKGAAAAYSLRIAFDAGMVIWFSKRILALRYDLTHYLLWFVIGILMLSPPVIFAVAFDNFSVWLFPLTAVSLFFYLGLIWKVLIRENERDWVISKLNRLRA